ncbi:unnamed protein product [Dicrocoelium dendriticum]|nr:unnamed protein product [Dicrocoelium dendriticum]
MDIGLGSFTFDHFSHHALFQSLSNYFCICFFINPTRCFRPHISRITLPRISRRVRAKIQSLLLENIRDFHSSSAATDSVAPTSNFPHHPAPNECKRLFDQSDSGPLKSDYKNDLFRESYAGSATFLKGTQSANPHNDYCQHFVDTGERPQNFIRDTGLRNRFEEYPKLRELIRLKDDLIQSRGFPPMYLQADLKTFDLTKLKTKFDVVLIEPPLEEYHRMNGALFDQHWTWDEIERLEIEQIVAPRSFVWIWCGSGEGLDAARTCLRKWGFRRCEDICWIKTNKGTPGHEALEPGAVFQRTKEHCLMGIHGTVRRSTDGDFIHANVDIDLIIEDSPKYGGYASKDKPTEIFHIIEHFCLGRRRLHLFGRDSTLRAGWLTVGNELSASNFDSRLYASNFSKEPNGWLLGTTEEIERMRPKSPPPRGVVNTGNLAFATPVSKSQALVPDLLPGGILPTALNFSRGPPGRRSAGGSSKAHEPDNLQPSLLGLPSPISLGALMSNMRAQHGSRGRFVQTVTGPFMEAGSSSSSQLLSLQAKAKEQEIPLASNLLSNIWPPSAGLNFNFSQANQLNALSSTALGLTTLRAPPSNNPFVSSLFSSSKINPAMLAALSVASSSLGMPAFHHSLNVSKTHSNISWYQYFWS